jgi:tetratricopeptide (TPR) repeat protein
LYYLGTLVPVIGLVQVGMQAMADRYMYLPLIGVAVILSWGLCDLARKVPSNGKVLGAACGALVVFLSIATFLQVSRWRDSVTLYRHALAVTTENWTAYFHLAGALLDKGEADEAIRYLEEGLRHQPDDLARINLGRALGIKGRYEEAADQFRGILERHPGDSLALMNLGVALERLGRDEEALACLRRVVALRPDSVDGYTNLGGVLLKMGRSEEAIVYLRRALQLNPGDVEGGRLLRAAMGKSGA